MNITHNKLVLLAGYALISTGVLATLGFLIHPHQSTEQNHTMWVVGHIFIILGLLTNMIGVFGLYVSKAKSIGLIGLIGFLIIVISLALYIGKLYWSGFIYPLVIAEHPEFIESHGFGPGSEPQDIIIRIIYFSGAISFAIGHLMLGVALLRAKCFSQTPVLFFLIGALLVGLWPLLPNLVQHFSVIVSLIYAIGICWLGIKLITES